MKWIIRIFGPPHELLHLLALALVGRRALGFSWTHVDIPDDLSIGQYVFVAGLPALVFWGVAAVGTLNLLKARDVSEVVISLALLLIGTLGGLGTMGDIQLILLRVIEAQAPKE